MTVQLRLIQGGLSAVDAVERLHRFQGDHPDVEFTSPRDGLSRFVAVILPGHDPR